MSESRSHPPYITLIALLAMAVASYGLSWVFPRDGIKINEEITLHFASPEDLTGQKKAPEGIKDAEAFLEGYDAILKEDSLAALHEAKQDSIQKIQAALEIQAEIERRKALLQIQSGEQGILNLDRFFQKAELLATNHETLRVLHYGDSQIEGDRITRYIRNELQTRYGGEGPGFVPAVEVVPSAAIDQSETGQWKRFTIYGRKDTTIKHSRYGLMGTFASVDSAGGTLTFKASKLAFNKAKRFSKGTLHYGTSGSGGLMRLLLNDSLIAELTIADSSGVQRRSFNLGATSSKVLTIEVTGEDLELYGLALDGSEGIQVDNIPMRGSSGTIFKRIDRQQLKSQLSSLNTGLVLLQYGGNTVPYVDDSTKAANYGRWIRSQILYLRGIMPDAAFILIGPSDMAFKDKEDFVTYPYLEPVRDALKAAAFETGCGFWDIYEVMGGRNSMEAWVSADPPLAGSDYVHFTPKGARRVAELFMKALTDEAKKYQ